MSICEVTLCFLDLLPSEISELAVLSDYFHKIAPAEAHVEMNPRSWMYANCPQYVEVGEVHPCG